uniref:C-type lectin mannose-binding isoform-like isoform X4 n=1 Tax=Styela clava TaxID=7725 RepID=UPI00193AD805|nr:C-type lectin mannose-binding isoform-like isoform X4 [Styela clava]XP_039265234.1 C-type lectin mannose-binding isoform-like isoform X4 [Styela clava]
MSLLNSSETLLMLKQETTAYIKTEFGVRPQSANISAFLFTWYLASNGFYYKLFEDRLDYEKAKTNCQKFSANLASVGLRDSKVRRDLIKILLKNLKSDEQVWIGVDDIETEGQFIWADDVIANPQSTDWW